MPRVNCWEFKKCGREVGGEHVADMGVCPAALDARLDGVNQGVNGGRACWAIAGTFCGGKLQGTYASKIASCFLCDFYGLVIEAEGSSRTPPGEIFARLHLPRAV